MAEHFSEDEARRIFARAAERQGAGDAPPDGLTLDELRAIGEASGIAPEHIAAAVAELRAPEPTPTLLGVPARVVERRVLPGPLSDDAWGRIIEDLRDTYRATGVATDIGEAREWTTSTYGRDGLRFTARPTDVGTELTLELDQRTGQKAYRWVGIAFAALTAAFAVAALVLGDPEAWLFVSGTGLCLGGAVALPLLMSRGQVRHAERTFGPMLDRAELGAHRDAAPGAEPEVEAPRLSLDEPPAAERGTPGRRRRRTR